MPVGPLFSIQCEDVEGPVDILLPHVLHLTEDNEPDKERMRVVHVSGKDANLLPVSEVTSTHIVTRFQKGSLFGPVVEKLYGKLFARNGRCVVFAPISVTSEFQIHVYIASNAATALQCLESTEADDKYVKLDQEQCVLMPGHEYHLEVSVWNGGGDNLLTNPKLLTFYDVLEADRIYKKFRVEVDAKKYKKMKKSNLRFQMQLTSGDGKSVCEFITSKGQHLELSESDSSESDSGLSSEPASEGQDQAAVSTVHRRNPRDHQRTTRSSEHWKQKSSRSRAAGRGPRKKVKVLLVSDEYCTSKGGISTINLNVARMLTAAGAEVYAIVLEASQQDERDAERDGVSLLKPRLDPDSSAKPSLEWLTVYHKHHFPDIPSDISCIVGHVDVTSRAARKIKEERFPHAKLAMFGHVAPEETELYKSDEKALGVGRKEASIQDDIGKADVVFSVGPRIHRHYDRFLRQRHVTHHIFLPEPSKVFSEANVSFGEEDKVEKPERVVLSIGRVRNVEMLKGHDLAAGSIDKAAQRLDNQYTLRLRVRGIDENDFTDSKRILEEKLRSGRVKATLLPYGTQEEIRRDMEACHLVLMPSRAEPFGLVGLEAIAAGVPVLISEQSGLAELVAQLAKKYQPKFRNCIVKMTGDTATDADAEKWADSIEDFLTNARSEFAEARAFREKLLFSKYWEESHKTFLQACGITDGGSAQAEGGGAEADDSD
ncbi:uncharacterized protein LOC118411394 [Branchiostoma floridae]|uniref:Uncharacterized protein LOC118411394 n=1 Tax=Branchiostoma floridae TaxID=7739 RepID=A0A9J7KSU3_BRAFL|nr:uncharacterized protein LOC118411394 [Branchiostoma floridae]